MKIIIEDNNYRVLRFNKGEEVISGIAGFCQDHRITASYFTIIGATDDLTLSYYNLTDKKYEDHEIKDRLEITGVIGNVGLLDGQQMIHAHGTFSDENLQVIGGHIKRMVVSATAEVMLTILSGEITRGYDEETGLNLMQ